MGYLSALVILMLYYVLHSAEASIDSSEILSVPSAKFWLGTDSLGRDYLLRVAQGGLLTLGLTTMSTLFAIFLGVGLGFLSGWSRRWISEAILRLMDFIQTVPSLVLAALIFFVSKSYLTTVSSEMSSWISLFACLVLTQWISPARLIRHEVMKIRSEPYIEASFSIGATSLQIFKSHLLPALLKTIILLFGLELPKHIFFESFLSFIGFGFQPPLSSWGGLIQEGWKHLSSSAYLTFIPLFFVITFVWAMNNVFSQWRHQSDRPGFF